ATAGRLAAALALDRDRHRGGPGKREEERRPRWARCLAVAFAFVPRNRSRSICRSDTTGGASACYGATSGVVDALRRRSGRISPCGSYLRCAAARHLGLDPTRLDDHDLNAEGRQLAPERVADPLERELRAA